MNVFIFEVWPKTTKCLPTPALNENGDSLKFYKICMLVRSTLLCHSIF